MFFRSLYSSYFFLLRQWCAFLRSGFSRQGGIERSTSQRQWRSFRTFPRLSSHFHCFLFLCCRFPRLSPHFHCFLFLGCWFTRSSSPVPFLFHSSSIGYVQFSSRSPLSCSLLLHNFRCHLYIEFLFVKWSGDHTCSSRSTTRLCGDNLW